MSKISPENSLRDISWLTVVSGCLTGLVYVQYNFSI
jgi:hypothetical protein